MTQTEKDILRHFRQYHAGVNKMLFFNAGSATTNSPKFHLAMTSLIRDGLVIKERRPNAYSLTGIGYMTSLSA